MTFRPTHRLRIWREATASPCKEIPVVVTGGVGRSEAGVVVLQLAGDRWHCLIGPITAFEVEGIPGRKPERGSAAANWVNLGELGRLRLTEEEHAAFASAALGQGMAVAAWLRSLDPTRGATAIRLRELGRKAVGLT